MILKITKLIVLLLVAALAAPVAGAVADPAFWGGPEAVQSLRNVPDSILQELQSKGTSEFFIVLMDQADVSAAKQIQKKEDKGLYVFNQLREVAERTQPAIVKDLNLGSANIQRFYIQNMILVKDATPEMLLGAVNHSKVAKIRPNRPYEFKNDQPMAYDSNNPPNAPEWNLSHIGITDVWAEGVTGEGIVVANLDTGVDWDHPALKPKYRGWNGTTANHDYNWHDIASSPSSVPYDSGQHGTHTMGTMVGDDGAGNQVGGAPGAKWIACGPLEDDAGFHECFEWFLAPYRFGETPAQGVPAMAPHVVNNSWGWPIGGGDYQYAPDLNALQAAGVFMEFSAGNEGDSCQSLRSPGDYPEVLTTGASDVQNRIVSESWTYWGSSRGPAAAGIPGAPNFIKPEIVAPGYDVRSCVPGTGYEGGWGGTSMAGPHTCAVVALMWSAAPGLIGDIATTRQIILDSAYTQAGGAGYWNQTCQGINAATTIPNHVWGWGLIDAYACYTSLAGVYLDKGSYRPDDTMIISIRDSAASGSVNVQIQSTVETAWEYLTLNEISTGQFEGTFTTTSGAAVHGDGAISVNHGSTVNVWYPSLDMSATATIDGTLPIISNLEVAELSYNHAVIHWTTDEESDSRVFYGIGSPTMTVESTAHTTNHTVELTGLEDCEGYVFYVESSDRAGNTAMDDNGGADYSFITWEQVLYFHDDMESGPGAWTYSGLWHHASVSSSCPESHSGVASWYFGQEPVCNYDVGTTQGTLTSSLIDLTDIIDAEYHVWYWHEGEGFAGYDILTIQIQIQGQSIANLLTVEGSSEGWQEFVLDMDAYVGHNVYLKFDFNSGDEIMNTYRGSYIDDVAIFSSVPCTEPTPTPPPTATPEECVNHGDVNFSGDITAGDAQMAFQIALGLITPTEEQECAADCNSDGSITAGDAQQIFMTALGTASCVDPL